MADNVPSAAAVAEKWQRVASGRGADYEAGVKGAGAKWEAKTSGAQAAFVAGVTSGNIGKMYAGGVKRAGAAKFERKASGVGKDRFSGGVNAAVSDYQAGIDPFLQTLGTIDYGTRGPRGDAGNLQRVAKVATALHAKRLALRAAGV